MESSKRERLITNGKQVNPAAPLWILRHHAPNAIHYLRLIKPTGSSELLLAAGDSEGRFSLTSLRDYRPRYFWNAHKESILGLDLLRLGKNNVMLSSGRDNQLHVFGFLPLQGLTSAVLPSRIQADLPKPDCRESLDINSLNYCPFSAVQSDDDDGIMVAVPHTVDSGYIDLYHLPSRQRKMAAIGKADLSTAGVKGSRTAIVMSLQVIKIDNKGVLRIIAGYEDGFIKSWRIQDGIATLEWSTRKHSESIMALAVSKSKQFCVSVAADRQVVKYDLADGAAARTATSNSGGHACVAIREDNKIIATGGWDGCVRLYNAELEQVGSLRYHKDTVQALSFVQERDLTDLRGADEDSEDSDEDVENGISLRKEPARDHILVSGGKEGRICLWNTED